MNLGSLRGKSELLQRVTATELEFFESISEERHFESGQLIFDEGGPADVFFIVIEGRVGLELTSPGRAPMTIQTLGPGDLVGVSWFFPPYRWNWRGRAMTATTLAVFDATEVRRRCDEDRDLLLEVQSVVAKEVVDRLHRTRLQLLDLYGGR